MQLLQHRVAHRRRHRRVLLTAPPPSALRLRTPAAPAPPTRASSLDRARLRPRLSRASRLLLPAPRQPGKRMRPRAPCLGYTRQSEPHKRIDSRRVSALGRSLLPQDTPRMPSLHAPRYPDATHARKRLSTRKPRARRAPAWASRRAPIRDPSLLRAWRTAASDCRAPARDRDGRSTEYLAVWRRMRSRERSGSLRSSSSLAHLCDGRPGKRCNE
jgi:hypothetical protein